MRASDAPLGPAAARPVPIGPVMVALTTAMLLSGLDQTIVVTALPTIVEDLGGVDEISWIVTVYLLTSTVSVPLWGKLSDLFGRRNLYQLAITAFVAGSIVAGASMTIPQLVAARALQGLGAGGIMALSQTILGDILSPRERGRYIAYLGAVAAVSGIAGPVVGGVLVDQLSWRWVFYVNVPLGLLSVALVTRWLHLPFRRRDRTVDYAGAALLTVTVTAFLLVVLWGGQTYPWGSPLILALGAVAAVALVMFLAVERRVREPIIPLSIFRDRVVAVVTGLGFCIGVVMFGTLLLLPLFFQAVLGRSATSSGMLLLPMTAGFVVTSVISGRLITRTGRYRIFPLIGTVLIAAGLTPLPFVDVETGPGLLTVSMVLIGLGIGMSMQVLTLAIQNAVPQNVLGAATSAARFTRSVGYAIGAATLGTVLATRFRSALVGRTEVGDAARDVDAALNQQALESLPPEVAAHLQSAMADAIGFAFALLLPVAVVTIVLAFLLEERPLRTESWVDVEQAESRADAVTTDPAGVAPLGAGSSPPAHRAEL